MRQSSTGPFRGAFEGEDILDDGCVYLRDANWYLGHSPLLSAYFAEPKLLVSTDSFGLCAEPKVPVRKQWGLIEHHFLRPMCSTKDLCAEPKVP